jgi:hypothetical protein
LFQNPYKISAVRCVGKRPTGINRHRREDDIKTGFYLSHDIVQCWALLDNVINILCYLISVNIMQYRSLSKNLQIKIYRTIILPVVLYGCEAWSLTLREDHRLRVFENRVLRGIFGPKWDEVTGK